MKRHRAELALDVVAALSSSGIYRLFQLGGINILLTKSFYLKSLADINLIGQTLILCYISLGIFISFIGSKCFILII